MKNNNNKVIKSPVSIKHKYYLYNKILKCIDILIERKEFKCSVNKIIKMIPEENKKSVIKILNQLEKERYIYWNNFDITRSKYKRIIYKYF